MHLRIQNFEVVLKPFKRNAFHETSSCGSVRGTMSFLFRKWNERCFTDVGKYL
jgi:hypothetical protein